MRRLVAMGMMIVGFCSCAVIPRKATVPVKTLQAGNPGGRELVVILPGRWSEVEEYQKEGLVRMAVEKWPQARIIVPDLHLAYYKDRSCVRRLDEDVIQPARREGVEKIRMIGISMGGMGALLYELEHPGGVDELILLSPYLGENEVIREIRAAGGLRKWRPGAVADEDFSRKLWLGLREEWLEKGKQPRVILGCGEQDRLALSSRLFADEFLSGNRQEWLPGGHDWQTWRRLLTKILQGGSAT